MEPKHELAFGQRVKIGVQASAAVARIPRC